MVRSYAVRTGKQYSNKQHAVGDSAMPMNDYRIDTTLCSTQLIRPDGKGITVFRVWPSQAPDGSGKPERGRLSADVSDYSDFFFRMECAVFAGIPGGQHKIQSWNLYYPNATDEVKQSNPYSILYWAAFRAKKSGKFSPNKRWDSEWTQHMEGGQGRGAAMSRPDTCYFMQGEVYQRGEMDYLSKRRTPLGADAGDPLVVMALPRAAGLSLCKLFNVEKKSWDGDEKKNPSLRYQHGDPVGIPKKDGTLANGWFYYFWDPKRYEGFDPKAGEDESKWMPTSWSGAEPEKNRYELAISRTYERQGKVHQSSMDEARLTNAMNKWQFWLPSDDGSEKGLIRVPSIEEQCLYCVQSYRMMKDLFEFGWGDHPEFFTDEVRAALKARVQVAMPGTDDDYDEDGEPKSKDAKKSKKASRMEEEDDEDDERDESVNDDNEFEDENEENDDVTQEESEELEESDHGQESDEGEEDDYDEAEEGDREGEDAEAGEVSEDEDETSDESDEDESDDFDPREKVAAKKRQMEESMRKATGEAVKRSAKRPSEKTPSPAPPKKTTKPVAKPTAKKRTK